MAKKDNISVRYEAFQKRPGSMNNALRNFSRITEDTYANFKSIMGDHTDIGKAAIVIMASNFASHLVKLATDESIDKARRIYEVSGAIAPMYELMHERLTRETIEEMAKSMESDGNANS